MRCARTSELAGAWGAASVLSIPVVLDQLVVAGWSRERARMKSAWLFDRYPDARLVWAGNDLMAFGGFYSFNHKHSISFGTRFYREPKLSPDDEDYPFIPKDENNNPIVGIEAFRPLSVSADLAYSYRIGRYLGLSVTARYIRSSYGELFTNNALGFDVAAYARIPLNRMLEGAWVSAGAKISDFGFTFDDSNYDLPTKFSVGGSLFAPIRDSHSLEASVDLGYRYSSSENKSFGMGIGVEYVLMQLADPLLRPIRNLLPSMGGIDFSPMVLVLLLYVVNMGIAELLQATGNVLLPGLWMAL